MASNQLDVDFVRTRLCGAMVADATERERELFQREARAGARLLHNFLRG